MFYAYAIASMVAFSLQNVLLVRYARRMDGLSLGIYRNASFIVTLLPLLYKSSRQDITAVLSQWPLLIFSAVSGGLALWCMFLAYRYIPVGVTRAYSRAVTTGLVVCAAWIIFDESVSTLAIILIALISVSALWLAQIKNPMAHLDDRLVRGITLVVAGSASVTITKFALAILSRSSDPLTSAYFWEATISMALMLIALTRWIITRQGIEWVGIKSTLVIALYSWPTMIGTGFFALALGLGPVSIVEAIGAGGLVLNALLAHWMYGEKLLRRQWIGMVAIAIGIVGLKFV